MSSLGISRQPTIVPQNSVGSILCYSTSVPTTVEVRVFQEGYWYTCHKENELKEIEFIELGVQPELWGCKSLPLWSFGDENPSDGAVWEL